MQGSHGVCGAGAGHLQAQSGQPAACTLGADWRPVLFRGARRTLRLLGLAWLTMELPRAIVTASDRELSSWILAMLGSRFAPLSGLE
jgi:hypothetical protein